MKRLLAILSMVVITVLCVSCAGPLSDEVQAPDANAPPEVTDWSHIGDPWVLMDPSGDAYRQQPAPQLTDAQKQAINEAIAAREHLLTGY